MDYGFIGTGTITEAIIVGALSSDLPIGRIVVSPRNAEIAARLAARFSQVEVAVSNQAVVDAAEILVLAIRPQVAEEVLRQLSIAKTQHVISLIAATSHEKLAGWTGLAAGNFTRAIPLPFVAFREGVTAIYPPDARTEQLFAALGTAVPCSSKEEFDLLAALTALMGPYFGLLERTSDWLASKGMAEAKARNYLTPLFAGLAHVASRAPASSYATLRAEFSTKGGLNEQVFQDFDSGGGTAALIQALDRVLERIKS
ncbi:MAG TPA: pyrroline-5-carboxylate reductase [Terriglobales bacterium]|nr:pyrroline-5-carboxylate reductase [Terriglobales bacterium]